MKSLRVFGLIVLSVGFLNSCETKEIAPIVENRAIFLELSDNLRSIKKILDKSSGNQFIAENEHPIYSIGLGNRYDTVITINSKNADQITINKIKNGLALTYWHKKSLDIKVNCQIITNKDDSLIYWTINIENNSPDIISFIEYPQIFCKSHLGENADDDFIVYPLYEGILLTKMEEKKQKLSYQYPGKASAQFMYYFDPSGGMFYASFDGEGYPKKINVISRNDFIALTQQYLLPIGQVEKIKMPYAVVTGLFGGQWENGASVYREWADKQIWTEKNISERKSPEWLKKTNLFINIDFDKEQMSVHEADQIIKSYHDYFEVPIITTIFGWEKHGSWIGPDYFPLKPNRQFYLDLVKKLDERGDHLHFFTSGFRWGVRKPVLNQMEPLEPRRYTDYDGTDMFMELGSSLASTDHENKLIFRKQPGSDNFTLCAGSKMMRNLMDLIYNYIYEMGVSGVDLDGNLGAEVDNCYNESHGHPKGAGIWQTMAMEDFLFKISSDNLLRGDKYFQGVEEPCERYIPYLDVFHGRSFTATTFPANGPNRVIIPLYLYLYHQYQIGYAGWIDGYFSPSGYERYGLGRAFILGMYPGVRVSGVTELKENDPSDELKMLKGYIQLMKRYPEFLMRGRMLGETQIEGSDTFNQNMGKGDKIPINWFAVQGITWLSEFGEKIGYALANLSDHSQDIKLKLVNNDYQSFDLSGYVLDKEHCKVGITPDNGWLELTLNPWQLAIIKAQ